MESPTKWSLFGIPVLFAAIVGVVFYLLKNSVSPAVGPVKAVTSGSGLLGFQQNAQLGVQPVPSTDSQQIAAVIVPPNPASAYYSYNVQSDLNANLPPLNAPTGNPLDTSDTTVEPGSPNAYPWVSGSSDPNNASGGMIYATSQSAAVNELLKNYGNIFGKSLFAMNQAGYLN